MSELIYYEQPLNERIRTFLRLEHLFCQTAYTLRGFSVWDSRASLSSIMDILEILNRSDFKTELLKELERLNSKLSNLKNIPEVDTEQLDSVLNELKECESTLHATSGQLGQSLRETELLAAIKTRHSMPGGSCAIDLPVLHLWLQQDAEVRIELLEAWSASLDIVRKPIALLLGMLREASTPESKTAVEGFYQSNLDSQSQTQLIRVACNSDLDCYAEISAGKHRLTIRFLEPQANKRALQVQENVSFQLTCCAI